MILHDDCFAIANHSQHLFANGLVANQLKAAKWNLATKLVGHAGKETRDRLADSGKCGRKGRVSVTHTKHIRAVAIDIQMGERVT